MFEDREGFCTLALDFQQALRNVMQGFAGELDLDEALDHKRPPGKPAQRGAMAPQSSKRRLAKDDKFGKHTVIKHHMPCSSLKQT